MPSESNWLLLISYDGSNYNGWQVQPNQPTIEGTLENALHLLTGQVVKVHGSGRTDAGVHARGQCFHFDGDWPHDRRKLIRALHSILPTSIRIRSVRQVSDVFHARFSVQGKRYLYRYHLGRADPIDDRYVWACRDLPLDLEAMRAAGEALTGTHDFTAYSTSHGKENDPNPVKTISRMQIVERGKQLRLKVEGTGFLYRMERSFAGALYWVGRGRLSVAEIEQILESQERTHRIVTAPAKGLSLDQVFY